MATQAFSLGNLADQIGRDGIQFGPSRHTQPVTSKRRERRTREGSILSFGQQAPMTEDRSMPSTRFGGKRGSSGCGRVPEGLR